MDLVKFGDGGCLAFGEVFCFVGVVLSAFQTILKCEMLFFLISFYVCIRLKVTDIEASSAVIVSTLCSTLRQPMFLSSFQSVCILFMFMCTLRGH